MAGTPFKVKSIFDYASPHDDDLNFAANQIITVTAIEDDEWYIGEYPDDDGNLQAGLFPKNFVEKYEPEVPQRPSRPARQKSATQSPKSSAVAPPTAEEISTQRDQCANNDVPPVSIPQNTEEAPAPAPHQVAQPPELEEAHADEAMIHHAPPATSVTTAAAVPARTNTSPPTSPPASVPRGPPPPVSEKPSSFKDRIAAFNKQSTPVKPFDPRNVQANVAKKPFIPPPPSRDAYVPVPKQEQISNIYRRDEDPEIIERQKQEQINAEHAGLTGSHQTDQGEQDAPKPQSLKDRIALLQAQQREQAERRAELPLAANKEKPPKPVKKGSRSSERPSADLERIRAGEQSVGSTPKQSLDINRDPADDGNEADQSAIEELTETHDDETSDTEALDRQVPAGLRAHGAPLQQPDAGDEQDDTTEGETEQEEETEEQAELRRKAELRERMAKMSGGMGMAGMFGGPQPGMAIAPGAAKRRPSAPPRQPSHEERDESEARTRAPPVPMVPIPGFAPAPVTATAVGVNEPDPALIMSHDDTQSIPDVDEAAPHDEPVPSAGRRSLSQDRSTRRKSGEYPLPPPPPVPSQRPVPPMPPMPSTEGVSDARLPDTTADKSDRPARPVSPPPRSASNRSSRDAADMPIRSAPPPVPAMPPLPQAPAPPARPSVGTSDAPVEEPDEGQSEYEGDYDTDIGSGDKHKAALKAHMRGASIADSTTADEMSVRSLTPAASPPMTQRAPPPLPPLALSSSRTRESLDTPRAPPPPVPQQPTSPSASHTSPPPLPPMPVSRDPPPPNPAVSGAHASLDEHPDESSDDLYRGTEARKSVDRRLQDRAPPPPMPQSTHIPPSRTSESANRRSMDAKSAVRRSIDASGRTNIDGHIARDVDLGEATQWWTQDNVPPPVFQGRNDILYEVEQSSASKRGGKMAISKDVYVLFQDYSQTVISARYESHESAAATLEQRHEAPPARLRQDQLEEYWQQLGSQIAESASQLGGKKDAVIGDGSPNALVLELIRPLKSVLLPVGTRAYGGLVYANMANASVQQYDEIRPGDIITLRNAKLQGKAGGLHQKYSLEVSMHVAVVIEWDGTKKKIRALEQGREKGKPTVESYRLGDLKSGEVKVWRVVGRSWVGWDSDSA